MSYIILCVFFPYKLQIELIIYGNIVFKTIYSRLLLVRYKKKE